MRESSDNIDQKNVVIICISFADEVKCFLCDVLTFSVVVSVLDHIFGPEKDKLFYPVFVFRRGMSYAICNLVLYL